MNAMRSCQRCEALCTPPSGPGTLHLRFPIAHSLAKVLNYLRHSSLDFIEQSGTVSIFITDDEISLTLVPLAAVLSVVEQADVLALFAPRGKSMQLEDYFEMRSLQKFMAKTQSGWLVDMMREERLTTVFQPIVPVHEPQQPFAYECLLRGRDGTQLVSPARLLEVARGADLLFQLDLAARKTAIREAARHHITSKIFINFTPTAIYDPAFCLRSTVRTLDELGIPHDQVVFEVIESDRVGDIAHLKKICDHYHNGGFEVALDDLGSGYSSLNMLHQLQPDYVKLDIELIRDVHRETYKAVITQKILEAAQGLGIKTVAEGVETAGEYAWVKEHGADYVQGYYISRPASPPPMPSAHQIEDMSVA